jgi:hypothetical protein
MTDAPEDRDEELEVEPDDDPDRAEGDEEAADEGQADRSAAGRFVAGFLLGTAVGIGVALLFAPAPGEATRERLGRGARRLRDRADDELRELRRHARRRLRRLRSRPVPRAVQRRPIASSRCAASCR